MQEEGDSWSDWTMLLLAGGLLWGFLMTLGRRKERLRERKELLKSRHEAIPHDKVVVAIELQDFFVEVSPRSPGHAVPEAKGGWLASVRQWLGLGVYFREKFAPKQLKAFLKMLVETGRIQLFLFTRLPKLVAEYIVHYYGLQAYFPARMRRYGDDEEARHAVDVVRDTRRVIILTPHQEDLTESNEKYCWLLQKAGDWTELPVLSEALTQLVLNNKDIDSLHDELAQIKVDFGTV